MKLLLRLYPRRFRDRYADELLDLARTSESRARAALDIAVAAVSLRFRDLSDRCGRAGAAVAYAISLALLVSLCVGAVADDCVVMGTTFAAWTGLLVARGAAGQLAIATKGGLGNA